MFTACRGEITSISVESAEGSPCLLELNKNILLLLKKKRLQKVGSCWKELIPVSKYCRGRKLTNNACGLRSALK